MGKHTRAPKTRFIYRLKSRRKKISVNCPSKQTDDHEFKKTFFGYKCPNSSLHSNFGYAKFQELYQFTTRFSGQIEACERYMTLLKCLQDDKIIIINKIPCLQVLIAKCSVKQENSIDKFSQVMYPGVIKILW